MDTFCNIFNAGPFMPHGGCYLWTKSLIALHAVSDGLITVSYYSIPFTLIYFVRKRKDLKFHWMFICFAVFILACGTTHLMEIWNVWHANYWLAGSIKAITAAASVPTAILLVKLMPQALALPSPDALRKAYDELERKVQERTADLQIEIAERKRAEQEIHQLNADLEDRVLRRTTELEAANKELEAFSYSVSHDLRAPLRAVTGFAGVVLEDFSPHLPEEGQRYLQRIRARSQQMEKLIDDLLEFSRLSRQSVDWQSVNTAGLVRDVLDELKMQYDGRPVEIRCGELPANQGDPALLKQVWVNLISNAVKYTIGREPAIIEIGCEREKGENIYFVRDNGAGFDMQYADKLFGVFQRLHPVDKYEGTGVGLAIVQRIVHRHGGKVWAKAEVNRGATFHFTLGEGNQA